MEDIDTLQRLRDYLVHELSVEWEYCWGSNNALIDELAHAWLNDARNSAHRFEEMYSEFGELNIRQGRILDMASGVGTFVYYGLLNGMGVWGIDPSDWKNQFNLMKADAYGYPSEWKSHFIRAVGEALPFPDEAFDYVSSYQTLEHVRDVGACLGEMLRVARLAVFVRVPDYRETFDPHYRLPWMPLFPRRLARLYLRALGRPTRGLDSIQYVTLGRLLGILRCYPVTVHSRVPDRIWISKEIQRRLNLDRLGHIGVLIGGGLALVWVLLQYAQRAFRKNRGINIVILKDKQSNRSDGCDVNQVILQ